jgi:integrase
MFEVLENMEKPKFSSSHRRHIVMPIIFRLLYCCGLRMSEAISLTIDCIDFENAVLTVKDTKFDKARYIPVTTEIINILKEYVKIYPHEPYLFLAPDGGRYGKNAVYDMFREVIFKAGIPHRGRGKGPRTHDLRHTFAVHCLQKWVAAGTPLNSALPRLSTYLGHNDMTATEQYLRLTAEVYPEVLEQLESKFKHLIPVGGAV